MIEKFIVDDKGLSLSEFIRTITFNAFASMPDLPLFLKDQEEVGHIEIKATANGVEFSIEDYLKKVMGNYTSLVNEGVKRELDKLYSADHHYEKLMELHSKIENIIDNAGRDISSL